MQLFGSKLILLELLKKLLIEIEMKVDQQYYLTYHIQQAVIRFII